MENTTITDITLSVINDGDGSQCGFSYDDRCDAIKRADDSVFRAACWQYGTRGRSALELPPASRDEILAAASAVRDYYIEHVAE